jgi:hypothetical protein
VSHRYRIEFDGTAPYQEISGLQVGDRVVLRVEAVVGAIAQDFIDVTGYGDPEPQYTLGERSMRLMVTKAEVQR